MVSADGRTHHHFHGEIYNFLELRAELEESGVAAERSRTTEVVLAAWPTWHEE